MYALKPFAIDTGVEVLAADRLEVEGRASCLVLHGGAATSERSHWLVLRQNLASHGLGTLAVDFSGHGESSARTPDSLSKRYDEAIAALQYLDEAKPRAVIGISAEIAVRIAAAPNNRIGRLVTLVGAAYDSAAFAVPFGPAFTKILRTAQSWRRSVVFERIASFPGRLTVVHATEDTVVPAIIGELLVANDRRAEHTEIVDIPNTDHALGMALRAQPRLVDRLGNVICHAILA
ncbi:alpha/beta hydrolase [Cupriavidus sp. BIC8F]|uniref:alpha/beta hydrolase n=1 Tax=Cupriavidus sp. BIC8F TaxID=3079014 RepID=UPI0029167324|nr:alpha/beta fold hydrolase [Cupriavidus sp. BIC8F]